MKKLFLGIVAVFMVANSASVSAEILPQDLDVLRELYDLNPSLHNLPDWVEVFEKGKKIGDNINTRKTNIRTGRFSGPEVQITGVGVRQQQMSGPGDCVDEINLPNKGITRLPRNFFNRLHCITIINLSGNKISDTIDYVIHMSSGLQKLDLSNNRTPDSNCGVNEPGFKGEIFEFITPSFKSGHFGAQNLQVLKLNGNCFKGDIFKSRLLFNDPLHGQRGLSHFDISDNFLTRVAESSRPKKYYGNVLAEKTAEVTEAFAYLMNSKKKRGGYIPHFIDISCNNIKNGIIHPRLKEMSLSDKFVFSRKQGNCPRSDQGNTFTNGDIFKGKKDFWINVSVPHPNMKGKKRVKSKKNEFESKVSFQVKKIVGRYLERFRKKIEGKSKTEIVKIKNQEFARIKNIVKKYEPISATDGFMLKYLFVELTNL